MAITAERTPIFRARTCLTIVQALAYCAPEMVIQPCGPLVPVGVSWAASAGVPCPLNAALTCSQELMLAGCAAGVLAGAGACRGAACRSGSAVNTTCPPTRRGRGAAVTLASRADAVPKASGALPGDIAALAVATPSSAR